MTARFGLNHFVWCGAASAALFAVACAQSPPAPPPSRPPATSARAETPTSLSTTPAMATPPMPYEDPGACPFEGCTYREWTVKSAVEVRADRRPDAPVAFQVRPGEKVTALTGIVVTVKPGRVEFRKATRLETSDGPVSVVPGEVVYLLTNLGEGNFKMWFKGRLYAFVDGVAFLNGACDRFPDRCDGHIVEPSQTDWWIQIRNGAGQTGWTNQPDSFDGKDALG